MTTSDRKEQHYFNLAFELAYFIHVNKEVAFFVAEDALDGLGSMLDHHEKNRKPSERLRGFLKSGERTRPIRKTIKLTEPQMLQWLVYKQSEVWERQTERGEGLYLPTEEDLIVRYIEHLVFITLRRGSFYVTLAVGALLHQFSRRETRLFYDILTQSDPARMKDTSYIGKQRLEILERISLRFNRMVQTAKRPGDEKRFVTRAPTQWVVDLVNETLLRCTPWGTKCVIKPGFDITDIPGIYFLEKSAHDEEQIELNRIHTVVNPGCFATFTDGLSRYVRTLPEEDQDKGCKYDSRDERLMIPEFSNFPSGTSRGERFKTPQLTNEDYIRLQRSLDARAHRRRAFVPQQLCIYVDDMLSGSFDPNLTKGVECLIGVNADVIEVRGRDTLGELMLATLLLGDAHMSGESFRDSVVQAGGKKVGVRVTPVRDADGAVKSAHLEVTYQHHGLGRTALQLIERAWSGLFGLKKDDKILVAFRPGHSWEARAGVAMALVIMAAAIIWWLLPSSSPTLKIKPQDQADQLRDERAQEKRPGPSVTPLPPAKPSPELKEATALVARASWSVDREAALHAVQMEPTRSEIQTIDLSQGQQKMLLSVPLYDDRGRKYSRYRFTLSASNLPLWRQALRAPRVSLTGYGHILDLLLSTRQLADTGPYDLQVDGNTSFGWRRIGNVRLTPKGP